MAFWRKPKKRSPPRATHPPSHTDSPKPRKFFTPEVKLLAVKALEAGLTPGEVSEIVGPAYGFNITCTVLYCSQNGIGSLDITGPITTSSIGRQKLCIDYISTK